MYYECINQDSFNKLEVGKIYYIEDNCLYNDAKTIKLYRITSWQLKNMFKLKEQESASDEQGSDSNEI